MRPRASSPRTMAIAAAAAVALAGVPTAAGGQQPDCLLDGHDDRCEAWTDVYEELGPPGGFASWHRPLLEIGGGGVYVASAYVHPQTGIDPILALAYDAATGERRWVGRYDGPGGAGGFPEDAALAPDAGTFYVSGYQRLPGPERDADAVVVAFDTATGEVRWASSLDGGGDRWDRFRAVAAAPDGETVYAAGFLSAGPGEGDLVVAALNAGTGEIGWTDTYARPGGHDEEAVDIALSADGARLFVTGEQERRSAYQAYERGDAVTIAYDTEERRREWTSVYSGPGGYRDVPVELALSPGDGRVVVALTRDANIYTNDAASEDIAVVAYNAATGTTAWEAAYDGPASSFDDAEGLAISADGVFVTGRATSRYVEAAGQAATLEPEMVTLALDPATGSQMWTDVLDSPGRLSEHGRDVAVAGGRVYATGVSGPLWFGSYLNEDTIQDLPLDYVTVAYAAADGAREWTARFNPGDGGSAPSRPASIAADGSRVFVVGLINDLVFDPLAKRRGASIATVAYEA